MTSRMSVEEFRKTLASPMRKSKYRNVRTVVNDPILGELKFDSKAEATRYRELALMRAARQILWFIRQPTFELPGGIKYRADFLVYWANGTGFSVEDVKGVLTADCRNKLKLMRQVYGIDVELVKR